MPKSGKGLEDPASTAGINPHTNRPIGCDQVAWLLDIFDRYLPESKHPRVSQEREMMKYGMLYEVMDIAGLNFADDSARWNGTPDKAREYKGL